MNSAWSRRRSDTCDSLYFSFWPMEKTCAVPVLPATWYGAPACTRTAVPPGFTTPIMPPMMVSQYLGSSTFTSGSGRGGSVATAPVRESRTARTRRGWNPLPRIASVAVACASCSGVVSMYPWPMPAMTVSPGNHTCSSFFLKAFFFHACEGTRPERSPSRSMPVFSLNPNWTRKSCRRSMPIWSDTP